MHKADWRGTFLMFPKVLYFSYKRWFWCKKIRSYHVEQKISVMIFKRLYTVCIEYWNKILIQFRTNFYKILGFQGYFRNKSIMIVLYRVNIFENIMFWEKKFWIIFRRQNKKFREYKFILFECSVIF